MPRAIKQHPPNPKEVAWLLNEKYQGKKTLAFTADVERLRRAEPLAYVIGHIPFYDCKIDVSLHPMIPRPETEFWVEHAVKKLSNLEAQLPSKKLRLADTFSGSGCIGVALLKHLPQATVDMSDLDPELIEQIKINLGLNNIDKFRVKICAGNALECLTGTYDAIFANPPYIDPSAITLMDLSVINYEPHLSLFAGDHGLDYVKLIINNGATYLKDGGTFYIECDAPQREEIEEIITKHNVGLTNAPPWKHEFWLDQYDQVRCLVLRKFSRAVSS